MNLYRQCAGIVLFNNNKKVLLCARADQTDFAWQFPQGGIEEGETPQQAALRELKEETSVVSANIVFEAPEPLCYDFPQEVLQKLSTKGRNFTGQQMYFVLAHFTGDDSEINLQTKFPEFKACQWADISLAPQKIVPFKKGVYEKICTAFEPVIKNYIKNLKK